MKKFESAEIEVIKFHVEDVITTSTGKGNGDNNTSDDEM